MAVKLKYQWLGIAIPTFLISFIGYVAHYFVLLNFASTSKQVIFQFCLTMIWISYYLAIKTNPGKPPINYRPSETEWHNYCKKCNNFKPPRCHHCKTCKQCVLSMDHHCPWTMNCVGHNNFPHFVRFLFWVIVTTSYLLTLLIKRVCQLWYMRHMPYTQTYITEIVALCITTPMDAFVLITISILFIRCIYNQGFKGMTQIESWEMDRLENLHYKKSLLPLLVDTLKGKMPQVHKNSHQEIDNLLSKRYVPFENIVNFPYDIDVWTNLINIMGPWYMWLWPFAKPATDGVSFMKNELSEFESDSSIEDILLSLPWPPDGTRHTLTTESGVVETIVDGGEQAMRERYTDPRDKLKRTSWYNDWGEELSDFGVDTEVE